VRRLTDEHDARLADALQERIEIRAVDGVERFATVGDRIEQRVVALRRLETAAWRGSASPGSPALFPDQGNEAHIRQVLGFELIGGEARDADEFLLLRIAAYRDDEPAADA